MTPRPFRIKSRALIIRRDTSSTPGFLPSSLLKVEGERFERREGKKCAPSHVAAIAHISSITNTSKRGKTMPTTVPPDDRICDRLRNKTTLSMNAVEYGIVRSPGRRWASTARATGIRRSSPGRSRRPSRSYRGCGCGRGTTCSSPLRQPD